MLTGREIQIGCNQPASPTLLSSFFNPLKGSCYFRYTCVNSIHGIERKYQQYRCLASMFSVEFLSPIYSFTRGQTRKQATPLPISRRWNKCTTKVLVSQGLGRRPLEPAALTSLAVPPAHDSAFPHLHIPVRCQAADHEPAW